MSAGAVGQSRHRLAEVAEERREPLDVEFAEELREDLADDDAVFERVPETGRGVGPARENFPGTVARARHVDGIQVHVHALGRPHALQRAQVLRVPEYELRRNDAGAQKPLIAVDVAEDGIRQARPLRHGRLDRGPFVGADDERCDVELPRTLAAGGLVVDVVGDAVLAHHAHRRLEVVPVLVGRHRGERRDDPAPVRAHRTGAIEHLIVPAEGLRSEKRCCVRQDVRTQWRRRSSVCGKSGLNGTGGGTNVPGVKPIGSNRVRRRPSAS